MGLRKELLESEQDKLRISKAFLEYQIESSAAQEQIEKVFYSTSCLWGNGNTNCIMPISLSLSC